MLRMPSLNLDKSDPETPAKPPTLEETFAQAVEKRRRRVYMAIPASIGIGLVVAVVYLGMRIVSGRQHVAAGPPVKQVAASAPVNVPPLPRVSPSPQETKADTKPSAPKLTTPVPVAKPPRNSDGSLSLITPQHGEIYLQLAALTPDTVLRYSDELRAQQLEPSIAPGPVDTKLVRVLVGPFPDKASLQAAKDHLTASKIEWIIRSY